MERFGGVRASKRALDLVLALALVVILAIPFSILLFVMALKDGSPLFYVAERMKGIGQPFQLWKLRMTCPPVVPRS